jgi:hypothetical protein
MVRIAGIALVIILSITALSAGVTSGKDAAARVQAAHTERLALLNNL